MLVRWPGNCIDWLWPAISAVPAGRPANRLVSVRPAFKSRPVSVIAPCRTTREVSVTKSSSNPHFVRGPRKLGRLDPGQHSCRSMGPQSLRSIGPHRPPSSGHLHVTARIMRTVIALGCLRDNRDRIMRMLSHMKGLVRLRGPFALIGSNTSIAARTC